MLTNDGVNWHYRGWKWPMNELNMGRLRDRGSGHSPYRDTGDGIEHLKDGNIRRLFYVAIVRADEN